MIAARVLGVEHVIANLREAGRDLDSANRDVASKGSLIVRRMLGQRLAGEKGWDDFWGTISPSGAFLGRRSGGTAQRLSPGGIAATFKSGNRWIAAVGSPDVYMKTHEDGGAVAGKPYLRIPTAAAMRRSGTSAFAGMSARAIPGAFIFRSKSGNLWIARKVGEALELLFLLKKSIALRGRHIFATVRDEAVPEILALGQAEVDVATRKANS